MGVSTHSPALIWPSSGVPSRDPGLLSPCCSAAQSWLNAAASVNQAHCFWLLRDRLRHCYYPLRREDRLGGEAVQTFAFSGSVLVQGAQTARGGFCTYLSGNSGGSRPARRWQQTCAQVPGPASLGCVLPLLQPAAFLRGSSQLRSSTSAFLAGTKFSRLAC